MDSYKGDYRQKDVNVMKLEPTVCDARSTQGRAIVELLVEPGLGEGVGAETFV